MRQLHEGKKLSYEEVFRMEFRVSQHFMVLLSIMKTNFKKERGDFFEGVRAALVDKDRNPKWNPKTLEEVPDAEVDKFFQKIHHELQLE